MEIKTFGVVGAGQMGSGIAQVAAAGGLDVILSDIKTEFVQRGFETISKFLKRDVDKGKMSSAEMAAVLGRIKTTVDLKDLAPVDFVVEAASEVETIKFEIFKALDDICASTCNSGHQYVFDSHRADRVPNQTARKRHRHAFHESGAADEAG